MKRKWIADRLRDIKQKKSQLGAALSLPPSRVSEILSGKRRIQSQEIEILARFLKLDTEEVLLHLSAELEGTNPHPINCTETIMVSGEMCLKNNTYQLWPKEERYHVTLPKHEGFLRDSKIGLQHNCREKQIMSLFICVKIGAAANTGPAKPEGDTIITGEHLDYLKVISEYHQNL